MTRDRATLLIPALRSVRRLLERPTPFFQSGPAGIAKPRRMLLLSYLFAPSAQVGARRWLHLSRYAAERGWTIDVLMMDPSREHAIDRSTLAMLPPGVRLHAVPLQNSLVQRSVRALARLTSPFRLRGRSRKGAGESGSGASMPEAEIRRSGSGGRRTSRTLNAYLFFAVADDWIDRATSAGMSLHHAHRYDLIVSSGPPHMAHVAARRIGSAAGIPFVVDMRDAIALPEVEPPELASELWQRRSNAWEQECLDAAALAVANTAELKDALGTRYALTRSRLITVMNGADPDFRLAPATSDAFVIAHTGSIYAGRDPYSLFRALALLVSRRNLGPQEIRLQLIGETVSMGPSPQTLAREAGVAGYVVVEPPKARSVLMEILRSVSVLVVLPQSIAYAIPAKLFEYVQAPAWILALAERGSSVERVLRGSTADVIEPNDIEAIAGVLETRFDMFRRGERPVPVNANGRFDRAGEAKKLMDALDRLVPAPGQDKDVRDRVVTT